MSAERRMLTTPTSKIFAGKLEKRVMKDSEMVSSCSVVSTNLRLCNHESGELQPSNKTTETAR